MYCVKLPTLESDFQVQIPAMSLTNGMFWALFARL
jgi:hypothetical protein